MNSVKIAFGGKEYTLLHNGYAMFQLRELFGEDLMEQMYESTPEGFETLCKVAEVLSEQGELARRYEGMDSHDTLKAERLKIMASPLEAAQIRNDVVKTILKGFGREIEDEEKDLALAELEQKKTES